MKKRPIDKLYEKVLEILPIIILAIDDTGKIQLCSQSALKLFNISGDIKGQFFAEIYSGPAISNLLKKEEDLNQIIELNGRTFIFQSLKLREITFTGQLIIMTEITELQDIRIKLLEAESLNDELDAVIQASFDYMFVTDGEGNVLRINDSYTRITGIKAEEILGKNIYDLVKAGYYNRAASIDVIETKKPITFTQKIKTGKVVLVTGNPVFDDNGNLIRVVTNGRDITELNNLKYEVEHAQSLRLHYQRELQKVQMGYGDYIVASPKMMEISDLIKRIAKVDSTVLICGESGVGKEIVARELHRNSIRADKPYIVLNCAAIPDKLLESELFGYEAGAFTGAQRGGKMGIFQVANQGTLFLDEIGELPFYLQAKLLRVIQENEIMRIGGTKPISIDVRLITATNRDLWQMVQEGQFREDFYFRLNVVQIRIPPLRERKEEIPVFVDYFIDKLNKKYNVKKILDPMLIQQLMEYDWPGNVREIKNTIEQAFVTSPSEIINELCLGPRQEKYTSSHGVHEPSAGKSLKDAMQEYESKLIKESLKKNGSTRKAAAELGVSQATIWRKAVQYGIELNNN
ncbi:MAG TPA: transcriptional regulator [Syntrophomonas sp.]|jgi:PAS domain S-box-containing protein/TyrR family helix-turn-helix protein|nr:transcriptional regulator [Syntrophomonas sp.]HCF72082.1 transcriptional regulator [Syntrophomonas sp.]